MEFPFFHVLTFNYLTVHLQKKNWRDYIDSDDPVVAALLISYEEKGIQLIALEMLRKGMAIDLIVEVTKLTRDDLEELKQKL